MGFNEGREMKPLAGGIIILAVLCTGCQHDKVLATRAIEDAISFKANERAIRETFEQIPALSAEDATTLLYKRLGKDNLSSFLLTNTDDLSKYYPLHINPASLVALRRCAMAGKSLVQISDISNIQILKTELGIISGKFDFNVEDAYSGTCSFLIKDYAGKTLISQLFIEPLVSDARHPLIVYSLVEEPSLHAPTSHKK